MTSKVVKMLNDLSYIRRDRDTIEAPYKVRLAEIYAEMQANDTLQDLRGLDSNLEKDIQNHMTKYKVKDTRKGYRLQAVPSDKPSIKVNDLLSLLDESPDGWVDVDEIRKLISYSRSVSVRALAKKAIRELPPKRIDETVEQSLKSLGFSGDTA